jgi:hypothetical protein
MKNDHISHVIDRGMASILCGAYIWKMIAFYRHGRPSTFFVKFFCFILALFSFMNSQDSQEARDPDGFIFWHNMWHMLPIQMSLIETYDIFVLGEYNAPEKAGKKQDQLNAFKRILSYFISDRNAFSDSDSVTKKDT